MQPIMSCTIIYYPCTAAGLSGSHLWWVYASARWSLLLDTKFKPQSSVVAPAHPPYGSQTFGLLEGTLLLLSSVRKEGGRRLL